MRRRLAAAVLLAVLGAGTAWTQEAPAEPAPGPSVSFSAQVPEPRYPQNQDIPLALVLTWTGTEADVRLDRVEPPALDGLVIVGSATEATKAITGDRTTFTRRTTYRLRAEKEGSASIGPATAYYRAAGSDEMKMLTTERIGLSIDPPRLGFLQQRRNVQVAVFVAGLVVLASVLLGVRAWLLRRARAKKERAAHREPTPAEEFAASVQQAAETLRRGEFAEFYRGVSQAVRRLAVRTWKLPDRVGTTAELLQRLAGVGADAALVQEAGEILSECDRARYTGRIPTHTEATALLDRARGFAERAGSGRGSG